MTRIGVLATARALALRVAPPRPRSPRGDRGATAVEYALMAALIAAVIITSVALLGTNLQSEFDAIATSVAAA
ncbi:MAG TPA: Flp family type IVb pilin [Kineosporiaceae bacterium]|jgi:pilus assembly protein Flp/PilA|nr:Flp family type IVb pilin [Kineosporiaceae bacterium]